MKKIFAALLTLCVMLSCLPAVSAQVPISVFLDHEQISFDVEPIIQNDRTMVPMRAIFEALGALVSWNEETRSVVAEKDGVTIRITIGRSVMYRNDEAFTLDAPPMILEDRTLVPLRAVSEAFGADVRWNEVLRRVDIYSDPAYDIFRKELLITQLSPEDEAYFRDHISEACYEFLGYSYPSMFLLNPEEAYESILAKDEAFLASADTIWNETVMYYILMCQVYSETTIYQPPHNITDDQYYDIYLELTQELGYASEKMFAASYRTLSDGTPILFLSFFPEDCVARYACIVAKDNAVRYFASTTDGVNQSHVLTEEVVPAFRTTEDDLFFDYLVHAEHAADESAFLECVETALAE